MISNDKDPQVSADKDDISQEYLLLMQNTRKAFTAKADKALEKAGLSLATGMCFFALDRLGDGARQVTLAEDMGVAAPTLVRQLDILEENGWITRRGAKGDRRAKLVYLTKDGQVVLTKVNKIIRDLTRNMMAGIPVSDIEKAIEVFAKIVENASKLESPKDT
jgi:MarR family transcriptional regulator for hemolysin